VNAIFEREGARVLRDPWAAREDYIDVILDRDDPALAHFLDAMRWAGQRCKPFSNCWRCSATRC
jgi:alpha-amylase/alpha-mannosidase (GH57 family)